MSLHPTPQKWQQIPDEEIQLEVTLMQLRKSLEQLTKEEVIEQFMRLVSKMKRID
jgi:hypothetical protein